MGLLIRMNTLILVHKKREDRKQTAGKQDLLPPTVTCEGTSFVQTTVWFSFTAHSKRCLSPYWSRLDLLHSLLPLLAKCCLKRPASDRSCHSVLVCGSSSAPQPQCPPRGDRRAHWWGRKEGVPASQSACPRTGPLGKDQEQTADRQPLAGAPSGS